MANHQDEDGQIKRDLHTWEVAEILSKIRTDIALLKRAVDGLYETQKYLVRREEFSPVKLIVYGLAAAILSGVLASVLTLILKTHA